MKKTVVWLAVASVFSANAIAEDFVNILHKSHYIGKPLEWTEWTKVGDSFNCTTWTPEKSTIDYGTTFNQTRDCDQNQERTKGSLKESRIERVTESQEAVGEKNFVTGERVTEWSVWSDTSSKYDCESWNPHTDTISLSNSFTQSRNCSVDQERTRDVYEIWADGTETAIRTETETRVDLRNETQSASGTKPTMVVEDKTFIEGDSDTNATIKVRLSNASTLPITVDYETEYVTADANDITAANGTVSFVAGETVKDININIKGDYVLEDHEMFKVKISNATNADIIDSEAEISINNNDVIYEFNTLPLYGIVQYNDGNGWKQVVANTEYSREFDFRYNPTEEDVLAVSRDVKVGAFDTDPSTPSVIDGNHSLSEWGSVSGNTATFVENGVTIRTVLSHGNIKYNVDDTGIGSSSFSNKNDANKYYEIESPMKFRITLTGDFLNDVSLTATALGGCFDIGSGCETKVKIDAYDKDNNFISSQGGYRQSGLVIDNYFFSGTTPIKYIDVYPVPTNAGGNNSNLSSGNMVFANLTVSRSAFEVMDYKMIDVDGNETTQTLRLNINEGNANTNVDLNDILEQ